jgi:hypothetical protein
LFLVTLPQDLLAQATHLSTLEARRPKQASLRRAVSAAYYALFHYATDAIAAQTAGSDRKLRLRIARSFSHGVLKETCTAITAANKGGWTRPQTRVAGLFDLPLETEIATAADSFVQLQEARHSADYDLAEPLTRVDVQQSIEQARTAIANLESVRARPNLSRFYAALAFAKLWDR